MKSISKNLLLSIGIFSLLGLNLSCKKQNDFLSAIPDASLAVPTTLAQIQAMTQYNSLFNKADPAFQVLSDDEYYFTTSFYLTIPQMQQNGYIWAKDIYPAQAVGDWNQPYQQVEYANIILESLDRIKISDNERIQYNTIKGTALFFRSWSFYNLLQLFAKPYDSTTASTDLGIPLRLKSALELRSTRASVAECYNQIIVDVETAISLLPTTTINITQPTNYAAKAFLARVYIAMGKYAQAFQFADACLAQFNTLTDYNSLVPTALPISASYLTEDFYHSNMINYKFSLSSQTQVDSNLYRSYDPNDLRKGVFFRTVSGRISFKGTYDIIKFNLYSGIATDEIYLVRAECYARLNNPSAALGDLNTLLVKRWKTGTFVPYTTANTSDVLGLILNERRKELYMRGLRWTDLRRLNKEPQFAITLTRFINNITYTLPPNDPRYVLPIPDQEIQISGIQQNPR